MCLLLGAVVSFVASADADAVAPLKTTVSEGRYKIQDKRQNQVGQPV